MRKIFNKKIVLSAFILAGVGTIGANNFSNINKLSDQEKKEFVESLDPEMVNYLIQNPETLIKIVNE